MAAQRRTLAWSELRVGILVIASFVLLALAIFYISGASGFFEPQYSITAFFPSANGLRKGAEVWLEGEVGEEAERHGGVAEGAGAVAVAKDGGLAAGVDVGEEAKGQVVAT